MKSSLALTYFLMVVLFVAAAGGRLEGRLFPVTSPAIISRIETVDDTRSRFWGQSRRVRNCAFVRLEWGLVTGTHISAVDLQFEEPDKVRGPGVFDFGPWVVQLRPEQLQNRSRAVVYHRCHALWLTETVFYLPS